MWDLNVARVLETTCSEQTVTKSDNKFVTHFTYKNGITISTTDCENFSFTAEQGSVAYERTFLPFNGYSYVFATPLDNLIKELEDLTTQLSKVPKTYMTKC